MSKAYWIFVWFLLLFSGVGFSYSQEIPTPTTTTPKIKGTVTKEQLEGPLVPLVQLGGSFYTYRGYLVTDYKSIRTLVLRLNDAQADGSIHDMDNFKNVGDVMLVGALGGYAAWAVMYLSNLHNQDPGLADTFLLSGLGLGFAHLIFIHIAGNDLKDAVKRYNKVLTDKAELSMTCLPMNQNTGLGLVLRF